MCEETRGAVTRGEVNPAALSPKQALLRLQKIMDEYVAGQGSGYITNGPTLTRGLELLHMLREDLPRMAARDRHELLRSWEVWDRYYCAEAHARHVLFREETRWPGYYYRGDFPKLDEAELEVLHHVAVRRGEGRVDARQEAVHRAHPLTRGHCGPRARGSGDTAGAGWVGSSDHDRRGSGGPLKCSQSDAFSALPGLRGTGQPDPTHPAPTASPGEARGRF